MKLLKILKDNAPGLRKKSTFADPLDVSNKQLAKDMIYTLSQCGGIGLAAPQVGVNINLIILKVGTVHLTERVMFNPVILSSEGTKWMEEGCLSLPGKTVNLKRAKRIKVKYQDIDGNEIVEKFTNLPARVVLHEIDHLRGILMTDYS